MQPVSEQLLEQIDQYIEDLFVPPDAALGIDTLQPKFADGVTAAASTANVVAILPSVLTLSTGTVFDPLTGSNLAIFHGNTGTVVDQAHPATAGEVLVMYASGMGPTSPMVPAGTAAPANPLAVTVNQAFVTTGPTVTAVQFSGLAPGMVGVYQINFAVPSGLKAGAQPLAISAAGQSSGSTGFLFVK